MMQRGSTLGGAPARSPLWAFADDGSDSAHSGSGAALPAAAADAIAGALSGTDRRALRLVDRAARAWHDVRVHKLEVDVNEQSSYDEFLAVARALPAAIAEGRLPALRGARIRVHHYQASYFIWAAEIVCRALPLLAPRLEALELRMSSTVDDGANLPWIMHNVAALTSLTRLALTAYVNKPFCPPWPWPALRVGAEGHGGRAPGEARAHANVRCVCGMIPACTYVN